MKILHCVEFYSPSPGGAQAVVQHISEELVRRGHEVTVATTRLPERRETSLNGVSIEEFEISGNAVRGIAGEVGRYRRFVAQGDFDVLMTYAAQQWTTDALLDVLDRIPYTKALAPCGFSGLADPAYRDYFSALPQSLARFDRLIFHSDTYQDIQFARDAGLTNLSVIPNGASRQEFAETSIEFRERHGIDPEEPLLLTVGPHNRLKGHALALDGFRRSRLASGVFVVIGNKPNRLGCQWDCRGHAITIGLRSGRRKRVILLDPPREEVLGAYGAADLFVFGSQVECSPLVLFEAAASGTPFISVDSGNASEIAEWTGAGVIVPSSRGANGRVSASTVAMAAAITDLWNSPEQRRRLAEEGRAAWSQEFTWDRLAERYEQEYAHLALRRRPDPRRRGGLRPSPGAVRGGAR